MHGRQAFSQATPNASQHTTVVSTSSLLFVVCSTAITHYVANCQRTACGRACSSCAKNSMCGWVGQTVSGWLGRRDGGRGGGDWVCVQVCVDISVTSCHVTDLQHLYHHQVSCRIGRSIRSVGLCLCWVCR